MSKQTDKIDAASVLLSHVKRAARAERRERIALALLIAMCPVGPNGPGKYAIVNAIDAADRFIAELDGEPY